MPLCHHEVIYLVTFILQHKLFTQGRYDAFVNAVNQALNHIIPLQKKTKEQEWTTNGCLTGDVVIPPADAVLDISVSDSTETEQATALKPK